jgi:uncharacterized C2H2 Zn-finger protein
VVTKYKYKNAVEKRVGEHKCPYCGKIFHLSESLAGHIGGAHRRFTTLKGRPHCKFCEEELVKGKNWPGWAIKQQNLICKRCKRNQNRKSYLKKMNTRKENRRLYEERRAKALANRLKREKEKANG